MVDHPGVQSPFYRELYGDVLADDRIGPTGFGPLINLMPERYWNCSCHGWKYQRRTIPMESTMAQKHSVRLLSEMSEFATFTAAEQRYIRRSLDVGLNRRGPAERWARNADEAATIGSQAKRYRMLDLIRACVPDDLDIDAVEACVGPLIALAAFDLGERKLSSFAAFRFLYERIVGSPVRPWLPSVFCAAAALPHLHPEQRKLLLQSIKGYEAVAPGWSSLEPLFYPEWVEKVPEVVN